MWELIIIFLVACFLSILFHEDKYKLYAYSASKRKVDEHAFVTAPKSAFVRAPQSDIPELPDYYAVLYYAKGAKTGIILYLYKTSAECLTR